MRLRSDVLKVAGALLALTVIAGAAAPVLAASSGTPVYTWVDKNGVRHYADHPGSPNAVLVSLQVVPGQTSARPAAARKSAPASTARVPRTVPSPAAAKASAARRRAECTTLKRQLREVRSARRVRVSENGKSHMVTGENLVKFRQELKSRIKQACSPPSS